MSQSLTSISGLRWWSETEIELREAFQSRTVAAVKSALLGLNPAWRFARTEGPVLTSQAMMSDAYEPGDFFPVQWRKADQAWALRAETTASSYLAAKDMIARGQKLPLCVWQSGKSFRTESNDGASAAKLRFNEFWQLEFQCIYRADTKADYRAAVMPAVSTEVRRFTGCETRQVASDRLPAYSESTIDIEAFWRGAWKEVASCSIRTDFSGDVRVCEIAIGLCRVAEMAGEL